MHQNAVRFLQFMPRWQIDLVEERRRLWLLQLDLEATRLVVRQLKLKVAIVDRFAVLVPFPRLQAE